MRAHVHTQPPCNRLLHAPHPCLHPFAPNNATCAQHLKEVEGCRVLGIEICEGALPVQEHPFTGAGRPTREGAVTRVPGSVRGCTALRVLAGLGWAGLG